MPVIDVALTTVTFVAGEPAKVSVAPATKFVPVTVTLVPPVMGPDVGLMLETVGAGRNGARGAGIAVTLGIRRDCSRGDGVEVGEWVGVEKAFASVGLTE